MKNKRAVVLPQQHSDAAGQRGKEPEGQVS